MQRLHFGLKIIEFALFLANFFDDKFRLKIFGETLMFATICYENSAYNITITIILQ